MSLDGRRLKIAMVALDFHREGGSEGRTGHLVDRLVADGHELHLFGARIHGPWDARVVRHAIQVPSRPHWLELLLFCRRSAAVIGKESFDIVHNQIRPFVPGLVTVGGGCHRFYLQDVLPRERGAVRAQLKAIAPLHRLILALEARSYRPGGCPFIIANSRLGRDGLLKYYSFPPERIVVAYNGVDAQRFSPAARARFREAQRAAFGLGSDELLMLFVGAGFARKGLGTLLAAVARLGRESPSRVVVAGKGKGEPWRRRAERLGLGGRLHFAGQVSSPEALYAAADVFVLPTFFDPFANATLEAMASGLPVVTSSRNGAAEILTPGMDGLVVERPEDVEGLAAALASLADSGRRAALGEQARQTALKHPWDGPLLETLRVYEAAMTRPGRNGPSLK